MAFKRSAVRSRLSPPQNTDFSMKSRCFSNFLTLFVHCHFLLFSPTTAKIAIYPHLSSAFRELKKAAPWLYQPTWHPKATIMKLKKNGLWQATTKCCDRSSQSGSSVTTPLSPKWPVTSFMWTMNAAPGGI